MSLIKKLFTASAVLLVGASIATAQEQPETTPTYYAKHANWNIECNAIDTKDTKGKVTTRDDCIIYHVGFAKDPNDAKKTIPVIRISVAMFDKEPVMIFSAPLGIHLISGIKIQLDNKPIMVTVDTTDKDGKKAQEKTDIKQLNFERCVMNGCMAALPLESVDAKNELLGTIKKANELNVEFTFDPEATPPQTIKIPTSLSGFTAAYDDLVSKTK